MSEGTFYAWKAKYSGMTVSEAKRLKALEAEAIRLADEAEEFALNSPEPDPAHVMDDVFYEGGAN